MREILRFDELTARQRALAPGLEWTDGDPPSIPEQMASARFRGHPLQSAESLYLVDEGVPLARVGSIRLALRTDRGSEEVCGVADVVTRGDVTRRGYARSLLRETHRRAKSEGLRWAFLWTRRSWGAHRAYEKEGYRDIYSPTVALRRVPDGASKWKLPPGYSVRQARASDADRLESLLLTATRDRLGFVPRERGSFQVRFRVGWRRPRDHWILRRRGLPVGYVMLQRQKLDVLCRELVPGSGPPAELWLRLVESVAAGKWLAFGNTTFVTDHVGLFRRGGYLTIEGTHGVLMACPLGRASPREWREMVQTFRDPRLSLHGGDMF